MKVIGRLKEIGFDGEEQLCYGTITKKKVKDVPGLSAPYEYVWLFEPDYYSFYNLFHNFFKSMWSVCLWTDSDLKRFIKKTIKQ